MIGYCMMDYQFVSIRFHTMNPLSLVFALAFVALASGAAIQTGPNFDDEVPEPSLRIVAGSAATSAAQFPYQVSMQSNANAHFCGGFIINNRWVGCAAHCTVGRTPANTRVRVGTINRTTGGTLFQASLIRNHPNYNANTIANDVSTVQTSGTIAFNANVQPIALVSVNHATAPAVMSGWGQTAHPGSAPNILQWKNTNVLTNADCRSRHTAGNAQFVFDSTICAFSRNGQGICMGDSGGPLVVGNAVVGIASWVIPCGVGRPDAYARVFSFRTWLINNS